MWTCGQCRRRPKGKQRWVCRAGQTRAVDARSASCGRISARRKWWAIKYVLMELIRDAGMDSAARRMFSHLCRRCETGKQSNMLYNYADSDSYADAMWDEMDATAPYLLLRPKTGAEASQPCAAE